MKRRVIRQGHNTLTITLPSIWAKKFEVAAGQELDMIEHGQDLIVSTTSNGHVKRAEVDFTGMLIPLMWRYMISAYRSGYDEIKIKIPNTKVRNIYTAFTYNTINAIKTNKEDQLSPLEAIQALVNRFVGFEIIEQRKDYCIVKDLGETSSKEFDNALRRIFRLLITLSEAIIDGAKGDVEAMKGVHIIDTNLDRFEDFCIRILNKQGYHDFKKTPTMHTLLFILELVGDEFKRIGIHMMDMKNVDKKIVEFSEGIDKMLKMFYDLHYSFTKEKATTIYKFEGEAFAKAKQIHRSLSKSNTELLHHLKKIIKFITSLTELRIDMAY